MSIYPTRGYEKKENKVGSSYDIKVVGSALSGPATLPFENLAHLAEGCLENHHLPVTPLKMSFFQMLSGMAY